jgi:predicted ATPase
LSYRTLAQRLAAEFGIEPSNETRQLHRSLGAAKATGAEDFVGRSAELRQLTAVLAQEDCRLVTIIGSGGIGKSRLVQQLLPALAASFDSVTFVPLEAVTQSSEIGARIAREPKLELQRNATPLEQVKKALHTRHALLVLNSFEHLLEAEAMVGDLLAACPEVKLVVTSRVRLNRSGEWLLPLNGLAFPGLEDEDRAESFDAVHLFVDRARRAKPAFSLNTESRVVCEVTRLVEGMPLALEVAAAWTRLLPCRDIAGAVPGHRRGDPRRLRLVAGG